MSGLPPNVVYVDGVVYPFTSAGIQAAINSIDTSSGTGGTVILPDTYPTGGITLSAGITMKKGVSLIGSSPSGTGLNFSGPGAAITFPTGSRRSQLKNVTIWCNGTAGQSGILIQGDFSSSNYSAFLTLSDLMIAYPSIGLAGQIGIQLSGAGAPADVQSCLFSNITIQNAAQPIVTNNTEGNIWNGLQIDGFAGGQWGLYHTNGNDDQIQGRIIGANGGAGAAYNNGVRNIFQLVLDCGSTPGVWDDGSYNILIISAVPPSKSLAQPAPLTDLLIVN